MNTSLSWIKKYVPELDVTASEYMDAMTLSGTKVEGFEILDADLDKIVIGQIEKIEKHPDADKLLICQVNIGVETIQIVTGADNVFEGAKVPVVLDGGKVATGHDGKRVPGGTLIKAGKLRGVSSNGMLCSINELGSSPEFYPEAPENGIYIFEDEAVVGANAAEVLGLNDVVFEYEVTSNRVDCYSVLGIAREAAATFRKPFISPEIESKGNDEDASSYIAVNIEDKDLCPRFCARVIRNVKIGPSPKWMQRALASCGIRPINNLVDITNYVMEELGQPMHAYDLSTIAKNRIIVRRAKDKEQFITLDGKEHVLDENVLMICDGEKAVGLAGIMGGLNSMITDDVTDVLFEAANFDGTNIRLTSKRLGLRTDASGKFEKGLDPNNAIAAVNRACQLIEELGVGEVVGGVVDVYPEPVKEKRVPFSTEKINNLLGTELSKEEMLGYLSAVELVYDEQTDEIIAPTFRQDINCIADIAEEVARFYGYDNIPVSLPSGEATTGSLPFYLRVEAKAQEAAEYCGFSQGMSYSFESPKVFDRLLFAQDAPEREAITISNPLGEDYSIMRTVSVNGMLTSLATNYNRRNKDVKLYELANIYIPKSLPLTELPDEKMMFTLGMYGKHDFFDMKGVVEAFFGKLGMFDGIDYETDNLKPFLHPGRQAEMFYNGTYLGYLGEVHPLVASDYGIGDKAILAAVDLSQTAEFATFDRKYKGLAKYPAVNRDISMVVPADIKASDIEKMIRQRGGKNLESVSLFDLYEGEQIKEGYKSMAYTLIFRSNEKTLEEQEISKAMNKILNGLESMDIELRK